MIQKFQGQYRWLSNFCNYNGTTVEHEYQAAKTNNPDWKCRIMNTRTPGEAKRLGRVAPMAPNWEFHKLNVMLELLRKKFRTSPFREWLLETGDEYLQEGNWWGDTFWGVDLRTGEGQNKLGKLIMQVRNELRKGETK